MRLAHTQVWPLLRYLETIAPAAAASRAASSNTMKGALPPSSRPSFFTCSALWRMRARPLSVEPVKVILRTVGFEVISPPIARALPVTTLNTPFGTPARTASSASARADSGVWIAGLSTIVHPAASAGPALRVIIALGKFHGVIAPTTPIGCLITTMRLSGHGEG